MRPLLLSLLLLLAGCATAPRPPDPPGVVAGLAFTATGEGRGFAHGLADPATARPVTLDDPVRVASVSKLVVALGVMKLVEQRRVSLGADLSGLLGWPLRNPAYPDAPVTLAMLLSHRAGVRDHDDQYAVPLGETVAAAMADPRSWDPRHPPGAFFTYANMNYPLVTAAIERVTGQRFDRWIRREILDPLKIDACFNWPTCSDAAVARAIVLTQGGKPIRDDLRGRRPDCPVFVREGVACDLARWAPGDNGALFAPQGGLRISVRGLARIGRLLLNDGTLDGVRLLDPASVRTLLETGWTFDGRNGETEKGFYCRYGLATHRLASPGPGCRDRIAGAAGAWVGHAGEAYGLRSGLWIDPERRVGIAYVVTGLDPVPPAGRSAFTAAEERAFRRTAALLPRR